MTTLPEPEVLDFDGPLGEYEEPFKRRRIAAAMDERGQVTLVRPHCIVIDVKDDTDHNVDDAVAAIEHDDEVILMGGQPVGWTRWCADRRLRRSPRRAMAHTAPATDAGQLPAAWVPGSPQPRGHDGDHGHARGHRQSRRDRQSRGDRQSRSDRQPGIAAFFNSSRPACRPPLAEPLGIPGRRQPNVLVLDSGLHTSAGQPEHPDLIDCSVIHAPWLDPTTPGSWDDEDEPDDDQSDKLDYQGGHGTFITGIVRQICPDARVHHAGVLSSFGDGDDVSVIDAIRRARSRGVPIDVVMMSFGAYSVGDRPPPMAATI